MNSFGFLAYYLVEIEACKIEAESRVSEIDEQGNACEILNEDINKLQLIKFSSDQDGIQILGGKEIRYKDNLYDIVCKQKIHGKEIYLAYKDKREDECTKNISDLARESSGSNSLAVRNIFNDVLKYISFGQNICPTLKIPIKQNSNQNFDLIFFFYKSPLRNIFSPPPNNFIS